ncbi:hypothetical protein [Archaeoglobus sp.]
MNRSTPIQSSRSTPRILSGLPRNFDGVVVFKEWREIGGVNMDLCEGRSFMIVISGILKCSERESETEKLFEELLEKIS